MYQVTYSIDFIENIKPAQGRPEVFVIIISYVFVILTCFHLTVFWGEAGWLRSKNGWWKFAFQPFLGCSQLLQKNLLENQHFIAVPSICSRGPWMNLAIITLLSISDFVHIIFQPTHILLSNPCFIFRNGFVKSSFYDSVDSEFGWTKKWLQTQLFSRYFGLLLWTRRVIKVQFV